MGKIIKNGYVYTGIYLPYKELSTTLTAGSTSVTFTDSSILLGSTIEIFNSLDVPYTSKTLSTGSLVLTFDAQLSDMTVMIRVS